jgi:hypothetical protein
MRKVLFKKWIDEKYKPQDDYMTKPIKRNETLEGTGCMSDFINEGVFHQWGIGMQILKIEIIYGVNNSMLRTVGIIETEDGTIVEVLPSNMKFISN